MKTLESMKQLFLGIDPGMSGGFALLQGTGELLECYKMPQDKFDAAQMLLRLINGSVKQGIDFHVVLEDCPTFAGVNLPGSRIGKLMFNAGEMFGICVAARGITFHFTRPKEWQETIGIKKFSKEKKHLWKRRLQAKAKALFCDYTGKITLWNSDAILLAEYGRRTQGDAD